MSTNIKLAGVILIIFLVIIIFQNQISFGKVIESGEEFHFRLITTVYNKILSPGEEVIISSNVIKLGYTERIDVSLETELKNPEGEIIDLSLETFAIETQVNTVKTIALDEDAMPGLYTINSRLIYNDQTEAVAKETFNVKEDITPNYNDIIVLLSLLTTLILLFLSLVVFIFTKKKR